MTDPWPWPADLPVDRARRIANSLLAQLHQLDPDEAAHNAAAAHRLGETWLGSTMVLYDNDQAITTQQAAELLCVSEGVIRLWACTPHPTMPGQMLLPRAGRRGRHQTYIVRALRDASFEVSRMRSTRRAPV
jgi:hypothetical protein